MWTNIALYFSVSTVLCCSDSLFFKMFKAFPQADAKSASLPFFSHLCMGDGGAQQTELWGTDHSACPVNVVQRSTFSSTNHPVNIGLEYYLPNPLFLVVGQRRRRLLPWTSAFASTNFAWYFLPPSFSFSSSSSVHLP